MRPAVLADHPTRPTSPYRFVAGIAPPPPQIAHARQRRQSGFATLTIVLGLGVSVFTARSAPTLFIQHPVTPARATVVTAGGPDKKITPPPTANLAQTIAPVLASLTGATTLYTTANPVTPSGPHQPRHQQRHPPRRPRPNRRRQDRMATKTATATATAMTTATATTRVAGRSGNRMVYRGGF